MKRFLPELTAAGLLLAAVVYGLVSVPGFRDAAYLFDRSTLYSETCLLALALTPIVVAGQIDLSCTAILALVGALMATLQARLGVPFGLCVALAPLLGGALGAINGWLVAHRKLPSLVVTVATMALFRGFAQVLLGPRSLPTPAAFIGIEKWSLPRTYIHAPMLMCLLIALIVGVLLHRTVFGRQAFAIGTNIEAARYSGVPVERTLMRLFILSGALAGVGAALLLSRLGVARHDHARGWELDAVTAVVLGGTSIFGGRGTVIGTMLALLLVGIVQTVMGVAGVKAEVQVAAIGALLILALLLGNLLRRRHP